MGDAFAVLQRDRNSDVTVLRLLRPIDALSYAGKLVNEGEKSTASGVKKRRRAYGKLRLMKEVNEALEFVCRVLDASMVAWQPGSTLTWKLAKIQRANRRSLYTKELGSSTCRFSTRLAS